MKIPYTELSGSNAPNEVFKQGGSIPKNHTCWILSHMVVHEYCELFFHSAEETFGGLFRMYLICIINKVIFPNETKRNGFCAKTLIHEFL